MIFAKHLHKNETINFLESQLKTNESWKILSRNFFGHWEEVGFGNLDKTKLEALMAYCLRIQGVILADCFGITLAEAHALNKEPVELVSLLTLRCLISTQDRVVRGSLEFYCASSIGAM